MNRQIVEATTVIALLLLGISAALAEYMWRPDIPSAWRGWFGRIAEWVLLIVFCGWMGSIASVCAIWVLAARSSLTLRWRGGNVLLDLGPRPWRVATLILAAVLSGFGLYVLIEKDVAPAVWLFSLAIWALADATVRHQAREAGISHQRGLIRWHDIASCARADEATVRLEVKHNWMSRTVRVPAGCRDQFLRLLEERAGVECELQPANEGVSGTS